MPNSYISAYIHYVFGTKYRIKRIDPHLEERLFPYISGIARKNRMKVLAIDGVPDHVHILLSMPATFSIAEAIKLIKGGSSRWVSKTFPEHRDFEWQEGYGAFTVSNSHIDRVSAYINNQKVHHQIRTFEEEYFSLLQRHGVRYDERFVLG